MPKTTADQEFENQMADPAVEDADLEAQRPAPVTLMGQGGATGAFEPEATHALARPTTFVTDLSDIELDRDDIQIPFITLAQPTSGSVSEGRAKFGEWTFAGGKAVETLQVVPLALQKRRRLTPKSDIRTTLCESEDARTGHGDPGDALGPGGCLRCPNAQWTPNPRGGKNIPPACTLIYRFVVYSVTHRALGLVEFKSTAADIAREWLGEAMRNQGKFGTFVVELGSQRKTNDKKQPYAVPTSNILADADQAILETARGMMPRG